MTTAIIFSRDRAAQLDLLLRSVTCNADDLIEDIRVVWAASTIEYANGYGICQADHAYANFYQEGHFRVDTTALVEDADNNIMFLTDDSFFYRETPFLNIEAVLDSEPTILCFSLRLGQNTGICYPLKGRLQGLPNFHDGGGYLVWDWRTGDADFGYPGSLDGHIFRKDDLLNLIRQDDNWWNPNTLEDALVRSTYTQLRCDMACFERSVLVGIPVNRTSTSHPGNRYGERYYTNEYQLNCGYMAGRRIKFPKIHRDAVTGAHQEMALDFNET